MGSRQQFFVFPTEVNRQLFSLLLPEYLAYDSPGLRHTDARASLHTASAYAKRTLFVVFMTHSCLIDKPWRKGPIIYENWTEIANFIYVPKRFFLCKCRMFIE